MVDGWWGKARHINYLGDWLMAWSWCLPVGFSTPVPYLYVAYFAVLSLFYIQFLIGKGFVDSS